MRQKVISDQKAQHNEIVDQAFKVPFERTIFDNILKFKRKIFSNYSYFNELKFDCSG